MLALSVGRLASVRRAQVIDRVIGVGQSMMRTCSEWQGADRASCGACRGAVLRLRGRAHVYVEQDPEETRGRPQSERASVYKDEKLDS